MSRFGLSKRQMTDDLAFIVGRFEIDDYLSKGGKLSEMTIMFPKAERDYGLLLLERLMGLMTAEEQHRAHARALRLGRFWQLVGARAGDRLVGEVVTEEEARVLWRWTVGEVVTEEEARVLWRSSDAREERVVMTEFSDKQARCAAKRIGLLARKSRWRRSTVDNINCLFDPKVDLREDHGSFWYGGPFFISCDHGCAHGRGLHAASGSCSGYRDLLGTRSKIWAANRRLIERADRVFAYIDETDCFGTLIELGYAAALEKPLWVAFGRNVPIEKFDDMWMARECGGSDYSFPWYGHVGEPHEVFVKFLKDYGLAKGVA